MTQQHNRCNAALQVGGTSGLVVTFGNQGSTTLTGVSVTCTGGNGFVGFTSPTYYKAQHDPEIAGQNENAVRLHWRPILYPGLDILKTALMNGIYWWRCWVQAFGLKTLAVGSASFTCTATATDGAKKLSATSTPVTVKATVAQGRRMMAA